MFDIVRFSWGIPTWQPSLLFRSNRGATVSAVAGRDLQKLAEILRAHERFVARDRGGNRAIMHYANLSRIDLSKRNLTEIDLTGANLTRAILREAILDRAALYCVNLQSADLRGARMRRADLRGSSLRGANFSLADLDGADLRAGSIGVAGPKGDFKVHRQDDPREARAVSFASHRRLADDRHDQAPFQDRFYQTAWSKKGRSGQSLANPPVLTDDARLLPRKCRGVFHRRRNLRCAGHCAARKQNATANPWNNIWDHGW